ncbi:P-selectin-like [Branchiostoma floridae x Branchiostoma japonicum]
MKFLHREFVLLLISTLVLESDAYYVVKCSSRPYISRASVESCWRSAWNTCYNYMCYPGCVRDSGDTTRTCRNGHWPGKDLVCKGSCCTKPPTPRGTEISDHPYLYGEGAVTTYSCPYWHTQVSGSTTKTCSNGVWTGDDLVCKPKEGPKPFCPTPPIPANTIVKSCTATSNFTDGNFCEYECSPGYARLHWSGYIKICRNGVWTGDDLECLRGCPSPYTDTTANTDCDVDQHNTVGARCSFYCLPRYIPVSGNITRTCSYDGTWTGTPLVCKSGSPWPEHDMKNYCNRLLGRKDIYGSEFQEVP